MRYLIEIKNGTAPAEKLDEVETLAEAFRSANVALNARGDGYTAFVTDTEAEAGRVEVYTYERGTGWIIHSYKPA